MPVSKEKRSIVSGLFWKTLERGGIQAVHFFITLFLARILLPSDYGVIAISTVFISIGTVFSQSGFGVALIQKRNISEEDKSSVFFISLAIAISVYALIYFSAPFVADFYKKQELKDILRVISLGILLTPMTTIQYAILMKEMLFKKNFFIVVISTTISGAVGITMAYKGYGIWALVGQSLTDNVTQFVEMLIIVKWRPKFKFSLNKVKELFDYGWKIFASTLLDTVYKELNNIVIGKRFRSEVLGYYNRGVQFPNLIVTNVTNSISVVMFPAYSANQNDKARLREMVRKSIVTSCFVIFPLMAGLAAVARQIVIILLTEKWLGCVPFMQIFCIIYAFYPVHTANLQVIKGMGRSDIFLKLELIKKTLGIVTLGITVFINVYAVAIGSLINSLISMFINVYPNKKLLGYSYKQQWKDIAPSFILSAAMAICVYSIQGINLSPGVTLTIQLVVGIAFYTIASWILKLEGFVYIISTIRDMKMAD